MQTNFKYNCVISLGKFIYFIILFNLLEMVTGNSRITFPYNWGGVYFRILEKNYDFEIL